MRAVYSTLGFLYLLLRTTAAYRSLRLCICSRFRTYQSERRQLTAAFGTTHSGPDVDHPIRCVLCTVLRRVRTCHTKQDILAAAIGTTHSGRDVDHPIRCMLRAVLRRFRTYQSERRLLAAAFGYTFSLFDVDSVRCVLCTVLRLSCVGHSERRPLAAASTDVLCAGVAIFLPLTSNDGTSPQSMAVLFLLLEKLNVPSSTCCSQYSRSL